MRLPTIKKISKEDMKDAPDWILGLINPLNSFMETVYSTLNNNVTLTENIASFIREISYTTSSTYPMNMGTSTFRNTLKTRATGVMLMQVYDKASYTAPPGPVYIPWIENNGIIEISTITGLESSKSYLIRLAVF